MQMMSEVEFLDFLDKWVRRKSKNKLNFCNDCAVIIEEKFFGAANIRSCIIHL